LNTLSVGIFLITEDCKAEKSHILVTHHKKYQYYMAKVTPATNNWHDKVTIEHTNGEMYDELG
jgi:hypothetical protein